MLLELGWKSFGVDREGETCLNFAFNTITGIDSGGKSSGSTGMNLKTMKVKVFFFFFKSELKILIMKSIPATTILKGPFSQSAPNVTENI